VHNRLLYGWLWIWCLSFR